MIMFLHMQLLLNDVYPFKLSTFVLHPKARNPSGKFLIMLESTRKSYSDLRHGHPVDFVASGTPYLMF